MRVLSNLENQPIDIISIRPVIFEIVQCFGDCIEYLGRYDYVDIYRIRARAIIVMKMIVMMHMYVFIYRFKYIYIPIKIPYNDGYSNNTAQKSDCPRADIVRCIEIS